MHELLSGSETKAGPVRVRELPVTHWWALDAITRAPRAWSPVESLAEAGHGLALEELLALDLVMLWAKPKVGDLPEALVTLTPWGAAVCRVELDERIIVRGGQEVEVPRWVDWTTDE